MLYSSSSLQIRFSLAALSLCLSINSSIHRPLPSKKMQIIFIHLSLLFSLSVHQLLIPTVQGHDPPPLYNRTECLALDCGSADNSTAPDGRAWTGDAIAQSSSLFTLHHRNATHAYSSVTAQATDQPFIADKVPYFTARISQHQFSYIFPVTAGQKFLRFHFYPSSYAGGFDRSHAFFSVTANRYTLLQNFSASLAVDQPGSEKFLYREFCINVADEDDHTINVTFVPASEAYHAFVNGIEIVSMPTNLYYSGADVESSFILVGPGTPYRVENQTALEMMYRLNVGAGKAISATGDTTGMYRSWSQDFDYLPELGVTPVNLSVPIRFTKLPPYAAPAAIYQTGRSMGKNKSANIRYNLTWELLVDVEFTYFIRLHFCEFQGEVTQENDREFTIYIANRTAEAHADVIVWSGGNGVPVYRDYAVFVKKTGIENRINLSIALHPNDDSRTRYSDAILNGIELFKLSNFYNSLAAPDPEPPVPSFAQGSPSLLHSNRRHENKMKITIFVSIVVSVSVLVAASILHLFVFRQRKQEEEGSLRCGPVPSTTALPSCLCRHFSFSEIAAATNNFDDVLIVGRGGFGDVYKGSIDGRAVAIKRLKPGSNQGAREFRTEIEMLSQLRHRHLVPLIGYCNQRGEMILVYDYMSRGTLRDHLYKTQNAPLVWNQRLRICIGAARGLQYLHAGLNRTIIHRDVKTTNILLDENWVAKVSDFGLSKVGPGNLPNVHISTQVRGSFGYLDPEYFRRQQLTEKSDVYSFGVVLLEVLCARPPLNQALPMDQVSLAGWGRICYNNGTLDQIIDPSLKAQISGECLKAYGDLVVSCLSDDGIGRPSMQNVVWSLEFALQLQESFGTRTMGYSNDGDEEFSYSNGRVTDWDVTGSGDEESSSTFEKWND